MKLKLLILITTFIFILSAPTPQSKAVENETETFQTSILPQESISSRLTLEKKIIELETQLVKLQAQEEQTIKTLKSINSFNRYLTAGIGLVITILALIQGYVSYSGAGKINQIMDVVQNTLQNRLTAEKKARKEAKKARNKVKGFVDGYQLIIKNERAFIENNASKLAQKGRHDFRSEKIDLEAFARRFDTFEKNYKTLEENAVQFTSRVLYIRGIAYHHFNDPEIAKQYFEQVSQDKKPLPGEPEEACKHRIANVNYYLGIIESNFNNNKKAIKYFEETVLLFKDKGKDKEDLLTKVVIAESYLMLDDFDQASNVLATIKADLNDNVHLRHRNRADLLKANMAILKNKKLGLEKAKNLLEPIVIDTKSQYYDPLYYYAKASLAQIYAEQEESKSAQELFREAHSNIRNSGDLITIEETRSKILLLLVSAICCMGGVKGKNLTEEDIETNELQEGNLEKIKLAQEYLDKAEILRKKLPKINFEDCTVFSPLSKRNENSDSIDTHIQLIRLGHIQVILDA